MPRVGAGLQGKLASLGAYGAPGPPPPRAATGIHGQQADACWRRSHDDEKEEGVDRDSRFIEGPRTKDQGPVRSLRYSDLGRHFGDVITDRNHPRQQKKNGG